DRRLPPPLRVPPEVVLEEGSPEPATQVASPRIEELSRLTPAGVRLGTEYSIENRSHRSSEVACVAGVVDEDAILGERERVAFRRHSEHQAVFAGQHPG